MNEDGEAAWERMDKAHAYRLALLAGGYVPIPLNGKRPTNTAWQSDVAPEESEIASSKTTCGNAFNTGILTKWTPAIDIDVTDGVVANAIADRAAELIDEDAPLLVRFGKHPKRAILFRTDEPFDKIRTSDFASPDGATHHVEILCKSAACSIWPASGNRKRVRVAERSAGQHQAERVTPPHQNHGRAICRCCCRHHASRRMGRKKVQAAGRKWRERTHGFGW